VSYNIRRQLNDKERAVLNSVPDITAHLLFHRGILDNKIAEKFLAPDYEKDIHDPFLLKDAEKSADRIVQAINNNERIAIYADYDADGIPGSVIFNDLFKRIGFSNFSIYIPHRHDEGFGLNVEAVEQLAGEGVKLLITVDCGVTDVMPVTRAKKLGMDVIITDHHEPPTPLPPAFAIVDHKQKDCPYPDKNLCGSGVAYKLIQAILKKNRFGLKEGHEKWLLDMVGIATLSDMVSLTGENRIFAHFGLAVLRKSPRKGLMQLLRKLNINQRFLTEDDIAFMITPRINAASRMGKPMDAFKLLSADTDEDAHFFADHLDKINNERKGVVASLVKEVKKILHERYQDSLPDVIVLGNPLWRPSLLGLVANSCAEEFDRPAFFWGRDGDDIIKGSCRSEGQTNVVELMRATPIETFLQFGGHHHSGGFAVSNDDVHFLEQRLNKAVGDMKKALNKNIKKTGDFDLEVDSIENKSDSVIDMELSLEMIDSRLYNEINKLAPFGIGNPKPVFLFRDVVPVEVKIFGKGKEHVELSFKKKSGEKVSAISFFGAKESWASKVIANKTIDLVASLEKSMYRGRSELRLRIIDVIVK
jgi:single-stranded-DNA-specific exonuclease